jgi:hypothetical protein
MSDQLPVDKPPVGGVDIRDVVRHAIEEFIRAEQDKAEPAYKAELQDERKRREGLEARLNQLVRRTESPALWPKKQIGTLRSVASCSGWAWRSSTSRFAL